MPENMFDEQAELDRKASEMAGGRRTREPVPAPPEPSALDRAKGRSQPASEDPVKKAARENVEPAPSETRPPPPAPAPAIDTQRKPWTVSPIPPVERTDPPPPAPRSGQMLPMPSQTEDPNRLPWTRDPRSHEPTPPVDDRSTWRAVGPQGTQTLSPLAGAAAGPAAGSPEERPPDDRSAWSAVGPQGRQSDPSLVSSDDEAGFRPGPLPKRATPAGKGGGGRGGAARRGALADQSRTAAYDPELDKMDPRNIGAIDTQGNVNQQVYAASPMAHPEAYPKGTDQFTKGTDTTGGPAPSAPPATGGALKGAVEFVKNLFHQGEPDQHTNEGYVALTKGAVGAPDDDTMRSVFAVVDPNNQLDQKHRMELATRTGYDWYMHQGQPEKAQKFATDALQYGNKMAQSYGDAAIKELKAGNRDQAIKHLQTGYGWLPDGYHADPSRDGKSLEIHDGKGKTVQTIPLDDKSIENLSVGMATGTLYWDTVQHRAGVEQPFRPQPPQPTQAVSTQPPQAGAVPSPAPAPAPAPAVVPTAAPAPAPTAAPAATPPIVTPTGTPPPQPLPAPAIAGPQFNTPQAAAQPAAATAGPTPSPAAPAPAPTPAPAISATPPSTLQPAPPAPMTGPVQPSTTKRPIVASEPPPTETKPPEQKAGEPPPEQKTEPAKAPGPIRQYKNDPDSIPLTHDDGETRLEPHRDHSVAETDMVRQAREAVEKADYDHKRQIAWIQSEIAKLPPGKAGAADRATLQGYVKLADTDRANTVARHRDVLQNFESQRREQDNVERTELKRKPLNETAQAKAEGKIDAAFKSVVDNKDKPGTANSPNLYANSPLRLEDKEGGRKEELKQLAIGLMEHNDISAENAARYIISMTAHIGDDENAKLATLNGVIGEKGSRFRVVNQDLLKQPMVAVVDGQSVTHLHVPKKLLAEIQRFKRESYGVEAEKVKEEKGKKAGEKAAADLKKEQEAKGERTGVGALVPEAARQTKETWAKDPVGAAVTETVAGGVKFATPAGWLYLVNKYGIDAATQAFEKLGRRVPEVEPTAPTPGPGQPVIPPPGT